MKHVAGLLLSLGVAWAPGMLQAQDAWPARPITFVVPYGAGGYTDLVARLTGRYVEKALGKPVIVDNRAGAGGFVGIHGTDNPGILPGDVSHGCIRMTRADVTRLAELLPGGTPLTITQ